MSLLLLFPNVGTTKPQYQLYKDIRPFIEYEYESNIYINARIEVEAILFNKKVIKTEAKIVKPEKKNKDILLMLDEDLWLSEE